MPTFHPSSAFVVATLLTSLCWHSDLHAQLLLKLPAADVKGGSGVPGYVDWIVLDSVEFSVDRELLDGEKGGTADVSLGLAQIDAFIMTKPTGIASPQLFAFGINGNSLGDASVYMLGTGPTGAAPIVAWKFEQVFVFDYSVTGTGGALTDRFSFSFNKIAFATADGDGGFDVAGWDATTDKAWTNHGLLEDLQNVPKVSQPMGDFNDDGRVDAADYTAWRDGLGTTYDQDDYLDWRANFGARSGEAAAAAVPTPAPLPLIAFACAGLGLRRRRR